MGAPDASTIRRAESVTSGPMPSPGTRVTGIRWSVDVATRASLRWGAPWYRRRGRGQAVRSSRTGRSAASSRADDTMPASRMVWGPIVSGRCSTPFAPEAMSAIPTSRLRTLGPLGPTRGDAWAAAAPAPRTSRGRRLAWIAILSVLLPSLSVTGALAALFMSTELPDIPPLEETTELLDRAGNEIAELHAGVDRVMIPFAQMPLSLRQAVVAVEDADFYRHDGLDLGSVARASWANVTSGSMSQGGSTITQQYVKNVLTGSERSIARKVREAILALKLEHTSSKREIL